MNISIVCDGDWLQPEVQISGDLLNLLDFGKYLNKLDSSKILKTLECNCDYYPVHINELQLNFDELCNSRLTVDVSEHKLILTGTKIGYNKLGDSLFNFFDEESRPGDHFQLDYFEGNLNLNKTTCSLIFILEEIT